MFSANYEKTPKQAGRKNHFTLLSIKGIVSRDTVPLKARKISFARVFYWLDQRHILRDRRPGTTACPACWAMGIKELKQCTKRTKIFLLGRLDQPGQNKNLSYQPSNQGRTPFICTLWVPITSVSITCRGHLSSLSGLDNQFVYLQNCLGKRPPSPPSMELNNTRWVNTALCTNTCILYIWLSKWKLCCWQIKQGWGGGNMTRVSSGVFLHNK